MYVISNRIVTFKLALLIDVLDRSRNVNMKIQRICLGMTSTDGITAVSHCNRSTISSHSTLVLLRGPKANKESTKNTSEAHVSFQLTIICMVRRTSRTSGEHRGHRPSLAAPSGRDLPSFAVNSAGCLVAVFMASRIR
jgi:hypothetical protein